jgi:hypothetical protein
MYRDDDTVGRRTGEVISEFSRGQLGVAIAQWRIPSQEGHNSKRRAFDTLAGVLAQENFLDVRLYMYQLSADAVDLFQAYDSERPHG